MARRLSRGRDVSLASIATCSRMAEADKKPMVSRSWVGGGGGGEFVELPVEEKMSRLKFGASLAVHAMAKSSLRLVQRSVAL